ncbi:hypothetical protein RLOC_00009306, partial [Lonchura striata]
MKDLVFSKVKGAQLWRTITGNCLTRFH